jgi:hypothetical protein
LTTITFSADNDASIGSATKNFGLRTITGA